MRQFTTSVQAVLQQCPSSPCLPISMQDPADQAFALTPRADFKINGISPEAVPSAPVEDILGK
jgi:hypothetical protein